MSGAPKTVDSARRSGFGSIIFFLFSKMVKSGTINDVKKSGNGYEKIFHSVWVGRIAQHQINSKWRDLYANVSLFYGLYITNWNNRGSGQSELDVMKVTNEQFKAANFDKPFTHQNVWDTIKGHPRWATIFKE